VKKTPQVVGIALACAAGYIVLAILAHAQPWLFFDVGATRTLQHLRSGPLDLFMKTVSWPGYFPEFVPIFAAVLLVMYRLRLKVEAMIMTVAEIGVAVMGFVVKPIVGRHRPPTSQVWVNDYIPKDPYTFTAGHVHTYMVIFGFIVFLAATQIPRGRWQRPTLIWGSVLFLVLTGISRVYLGDHWASDVIGAYLAGGFWLCLAIVAYLQLTGRGARTRLARAAD